MAYEGQFAETTTIHGHKGDLIEAYSAVVGVTPVPGVVVITMPRLDKSIREVCRKLARRRLTGDQPTPGITA